MSDARCTCGRPQGPVKDYMQPHIARLCVECRRAIWRMKDRKRRGLPAVTDEYCHTHCACGAELQHGTSKPRRICDACRVKSWQKRLGYGRCSQCGRKREADRMKPGIRFCSSCAAERRRAVNRRKNTKRRTVRRLSQDHYTTAEIGDRDGWRCHLCGRKIDKRLPGDHERGPTVDHLIPISDDDGHDIKANVAIAHRDCNRNRSNTGAAQLRLLG